MIGLNDIDSYSGSWERLCCEAGHKNSDECNNGITYSHSCLDNHH